MNLRYEFKTNPKLEMLIECEPQQSRTPLLAIVLDKVP